jgi:hypothetical protein
MVCKQAAWTTALLLLRISIARRSHTFCLRTAASCDRWLLEVGSCAAETVAAVVHTHYAQFDGITRGRATFQRTPTMH